mgnify:CR=1 FL=1
MLSNVVLTVGVLLSIINSFPLLCIGKFIYGVSIGCFSVFCPKYIEETAPLEIKGPSGALTQTCICFGLLIAFTIGLPIGDVE